MKYKGINRDTSPNDLPDGFGVDAKNGINATFLGATINEGGFAPHQKVSTTNAEKYGITRVVSGNNYNLIPIGKIEIDFDSVLVCSLGYNDFVAGNPITPAFSEIGFIDADGKYTTVINDLAYSTANKLNFSADKPVTGEFSRNYLNEIIVALTDTERPPYYINVTYILNNPSFVDVANFTINNILMFPDFNQINTGVVINNIGGNVETCSLYLSYRYVSEDLSITNNTLSTNPISIFDTPTGPTTAVYQAVEGDLEVKQTNKSITVTLTGVNTAFTSLEVLGLIKQNGVSRAVILSNVTISGSTITFTISTFSGATEISLAEFLTPKLVFKKVLEFTQIYNRLYASAPTSSAIREIQKHANTVLIKYKSAIQYPNQGEGGDNVLFNYGNFSNKGKSFQHKEVYAFFLHAELTDGSITEGFNIPFNRLNDAAITAAGYRAYSVPGSVQGLSAKVYQIEDTCGTSGAMGFWENDNEVYPDLPEFDSTSIGGENLRGKKVRHHRFPSIGWIKNNLQSANNLYGIYQLDRLGIDVSNVTFPTSVQPFIKSWFISYAKRTPNNSTVLGQSTIQFQTTTRYDGGGTNSMFPTSWFSGLNTQFSNTAGGDYHKQVPYTPYLLNNLSGWAAQESKIRFYDLKLLKDNPDIAAIYVSNELFLRTKLNSFGIVNCDGTALDSGLNKARFYLDYTNNDGSKLIGTELIAATTNNVDGVDVRYRKIKDYRYLNAQTIDGTFDSRYIEDCLSVTIDSTLGVGETTKGVRSYPIGIDASIMTWDNRGATWNSVMIDTYLSNLMALPSDVYSTLQNQELINTGIIVPIANTSYVNMFRGDTFITVNSYHTGGWGGTRSNKITDNSDESMLSRTLVYALGESTINNQLRSSNANNPIEKFMPKYPYTYILDIPKSTVETNKLYNDDYSSLNDIIPLIPYDYKKAFVQQDLNRINRCIALQTETFNLGWKTWLTNDYYITNRGKGKLVKIQGDDRDLVIQLERATYRTVGNEQLSVNDSNAFIGIGNIFDRPAIELEPSKEGTFGTQHKLSGVLTPIGFISIDVNKREINLIKGTQRKTLNEFGLNRWLFENLPINNKLYYSNTLYVEVGTDNPFIEFGYSIAYDPEFHRLIIVKKEYTLTALAKTQLLAVGAGDTKLRYTNNRWIITSPILQVEATWDDTNYFTNTGFTLSFDLTNNTFAFFHDYAPDFIFSTRVNVLSFKRKLTTTLYSNIGRMYIHNQDNKGVFYNTTITNVDAGQTESATPYASYITMAINNKKDSIQVTNVSWITDVINSNGANDKSKTFDKILCFNSYQSTPELNLTPFNFSTYFASNCRLIKSAWFFNKLKNMLRATIATSPSPAQPFIINYSQLNNTISPIDLNKPMHLIHPLTDYYLIVKLVYNNLDMSSEIRILQVNSEFVPVKR